MLNYSPVLFADLRCQITKDLKKVLKERLEYMTEYTAKAGERVCLNKRFTQLRITEGEREVYYEHELAEISSGSPSHERLLSDLIKQQEIFKVLPGKVKPRVVVTRGIAGIGKTVSVRKFILDWAMSHAHEEFHFVFAFPFCELNLISENRISLIQLVEQYYPCMKHLKDIFADESTRSLFIFDGLDESLFSLDFRRNPICSNVAEAVPLQSLLTNLIEGKLLSSASIWITTRPLAKYWIPSGSIDRVTEIHGFNDEEKEQYFRRKCEDRHLAKKIIAVVKKQRNLFVMCCVPAFCWILATVLEHVFKSPRAKMFRGESVTEVYANFLVVMVTYHHEHRGHGKERIEKSHTLLLSNQEAILNLGKLAFHYLCSQTFVFYEKDLKLFNIDITSVCGAFCKEHCIEYTLLSDRKVYSFIHATVQEFFAALYVFVSYHNEGRNMFAAGLLQRFWGIFSAPSFFQVCRDACNKVVRSPTGHMDFFLRFLCGLGRKQIQKCLQGLLTHEDERKDDLLQTVNYMKEVLQSDIPAERCINIFYCLSELKEKSVINEIQQSLDYGVLSSQKLSLADYSALAFVLQMSDGERKEFDLSMYRTSADGLKRLLPVIKFFQNITLTNNSLGNSGLRKLSAALMSSSCRLEKLVLSSNDLTEECCADLISILKTNPILKDFDLAYNKLSDSGVAQLSNALKDSDCEIQALGLWGNELTECCCTTLSEALKVNQTLRSLDLGDNKIGDLGVEQLCDAIRNSGCKIENLRLHHTGLTDACCETIASMLRTKQSLIEMELGFNNIGDVGLQSLSAALVNPNCKLETLG
uniref:Si:dkey-222h21.11 n=1 Tax=Callorhinchus milii TaxID=7868 RepID=A0A4W3I6M9_CALMI